MSQTVYVVSDSVQGAIVFTTKKGALDYVFQDHKYIRGYVDCYYGNKKLLRSFVSKELTENRQVSWGFDRLGDFTITKTTLVKRGWVVA